MRISGKAEFRCVNEPYNFKDGEGNSRTYNSIRIEEGNGQYQIGVDEADLDKVKKLEKGKVYNFQFDMKEYRGKKKIKFVSAG